MKIVSGKILKLLGWKIVGNFPNINKSVVVMAPHTSYWDFVLGRLYLDAVGRSNNTLMKKEIFIFPLNILMSKLGAIPIDRGNKKISYVSQLKSIFNERDEFNLFIAPEGTRKQTTRWKKGFFHIAKEADVPILLSYIDYKERKIGIEGIVNDTSSIESTMKEVNKFYKNKNAKYPENFALDKRFQ